MKKFISLLCTVILLFSIGATGFAAPVRADAQSVQSQINLIWSNFATFRQDEAEAVWSYAVTDLDHNGLLEILAGSIQGTGRYTNLKAWEVGADMASFIACRVNVPEGDSFPDVIVSSADTYYVASTDTWNYMFDDSITVSPTEVMTVRSAVFMQSSNLGYTPYAFQHTEYNGNMTVTFTDKDGRILTPQDFNAVLSNAFPGAKKTTTRFDWFPAAELTSSARLADSFLVFSNTNTAPAPGGSVSGTVSDVQSGRITIALNGGQSVQVPAGICSVLYGDLAAGCSCTVYFSGSAPAANTIYHVDIYGSFANYVTAGITYYCPNCEHEVPEDASVCPYCGYRFVSMPASSQHYYCPSCSHEVSAADDVCPYCGYIFSLGIYLGSGTGYLTYGVPITDGLPGYSAYCPNCNHAVPHDAEVCPYCGYVFEDSAYLDSSGYRTYGVPITDGSDYSAFCPNCNHAVDEDTDVCPYCGYVFETGDTLPDGTAYNTYGTEVTDGSDDGYSAFCPNCNHEIPEDTDVCPYCGYVFETGEYLEDGTAYNTYGTEVTDGSEYYDSSDYTDSYDAYEEQEEQYKYCDECGAQVPVSYTTCPYCGGDEFHY